MAEALQACRICGGRDLVEVLDLGVQALTGVFPRSPEEPVTRGPLILVKCAAAGGCGLLQLAHSYDLAEMYGANYGYRSGLNGAMVAHLRDKVARICRTVALREGDIVLDIGSNDGTTLGSYPELGLRRIGIDPTAAKFRAFYQAGIVVVADFFSAARFREAFGDERARVVTSFAMFYDMEAPTAFMAEVAEVLAGDGIWVCEQSYMPRMLETITYDTVCHEHLEYYALAQIVWMAARTGLEIVDVELNEVNGGSFSFVAQRRGGPLRPTPAVAELAAREASAGLDDLATYRRFAARTAAHRTAFRAFLERAREDGKRVIGLGASTKGNVMLQYCGITPELIAVIGEVNPDKFGAFTPGSGIPIVDEAALLATDPDYCVVLPWHFRSFFERQPRYAAQRLVFPLPELSVG